MFKLIRPLCSRQNLTQIRKMSYKNIVVKTENSITSIGINRPKVRNCVNSETSDEIRKAIADLENDPDVKVGILYGTGGNFCAGYDLTELASMGSSEVTINPSDVVKEEGTMGPTLRFIKKPMIAAVSGYAVAGGLELSLMCDLRVVEENAIFGVYCRRFGVPLIDGGTVRLQACVGLSRALDMILTGRSVTAKEAFDWGLANRIVAVGTSYGQALQLATSLLKFPQMCMNYDRISTYNAAFSTNYERLLEFERVNGAKVIAEESVAGAAKFVSGVGRHGKTHNLLERDVPDWEKDDKETGFKHKL